MNRTKTSVYKIQNHYQRILRDLGKIGANIDSLALQDVEPKHRKELADYQYIVHSVKAGMYKIAAEYLEKNTSLDGSPKE